MDERLTPKLLSRPVWQACVLTVLYSCLPPGVQAQITDVLPGRKGDDQQFVTEQTLPEPSRVLVEYGLPVQPLDGDADFTALRAYAWSEGEVRRLVLDGWVSIQLGRYRAQAQRAVVWIHPYYDASMDVDILETVVYLDKVSDVGRPSGFSAAGRDLLITAGLYGEVHLGSDTFIDAAPDMPGLLANADERFLSWHGRTAVTQLGPAIDLERPVKRLPIGESWDETGQRLAQGDRQPHLQQAPGEQWVPGGTRSELVVGQGGWRGQDPGSVSRPRAVILLPIGNVQYQLTDDEDEGYATLSGNLVVQYLELDRRAGESEPRQLTLRADRAVIFTDPISETDVRTGQLKADQVRGIYLEGNVTASDGNYTLRGPRMYYEFHTNRAIVPDAVLYTYSRDARVPLYLRAGELRQVNDRSWEGDDIRLSTSEFFTPTISLGASHVRIDRVDQVVRDQPSGISETESGQVTDGTAQRSNVRTRNYARAENATIRLGDMPVFWWPGYNGPAENLPLTQLEIGANSRDGMRVATRWDLFALSRGLSKFDNGRTQADLILQYMSDRGPAVGLDLNYGIDEGRGSFFGYLMQDDGTDRLSSGREIERDDETRGMIDFWHRHNLPDDWTLILEGSYISDPAFLDSRFEEWAEARREYQSRIYALQQRDNWALELFANYDFNDSVPNEDYLQSRGYNVEKLPEIGYYRLADSLFGGRVSYSSEYRLSRMRLSLPRHTLSQIGQSTFGFGYDPDEELATAMYNAGFRETMVNRFHTRHEMAFPFNLGAIKVNPFLMGRFTSYDDDLNSYSESAEELWWFGAAGVRASVQIWNVNNNIDNRFFDVHRMRHIMEPSVTLWSGSSDASGEDFPVYDAEVEGVTTGSVVSFALRNTWQTQRGGPGRWHSVDMLRLDGEVVFHGSETQGQYNIPRFFDYRPEYSRFGDHARGELAWLVSDSLAIAGHVIYDMNESVVARSSIGYRIEHGQGLFSYADLRYFDANDDTLLGAGLGYRLTSRYRFQGSTTFDLNQGDARTIAASLTRTERQLDMTFGLWYDQFREETAVILYFSPKGMGGRNYGGVFREERDARQ